MGTDSDEPRPTQLSCLPDFTCEVVGVAWSTRILGGLVLFFRENRNRYFDFDTTECVDELMLERTGVFRGFSSEALSMKSSPRPTDPELLRLWREALAENLRAIILSRTDLKSSKKIVSLAHLNTRANLQYGLMPLLAVSFAALTTTSVSKNAIDMNMHNSMTPNRLFILIKVHRWKL
jgi:hypothetical protein